MGIGRQNHLIVWKKKTDFGIKEPNKFWHALKPTTQPTNQPTNRGNI